MRNSKWKAVHRTLVMMSDKIELYGAVSSKEKWFFKVLSFAKGKGRNGREWGRVKGYVHGKKSICIIHMHHLTSMNRIIMC